MKTEPIIIYCILVFLIIAESCLDSRKVLPHIKVLAHA